MSVPRAPDLFDAAAMAELERRAPLAHRLRPRNLDEVIGQRHLLAPGTALRTLVGAGSLRSSIFFGPPGTGKTTVAMLIADVVDAEFVQLSAVSAGVREVREVLEGARRALGTTGRSTILFLDEIHRFNRSQQDALLPGVEDGTIVLIGATTENPFFALNGPLLSRVTLFRFEALGRDDLREVASGALVREGVAIDEDALERCCDLAEGDARSVLTTLDVAIAIARAHGQAVGGESRIDLATIGAATSMRALRLGRDEHYDLISALIKSVRGSDPDAGVYWLATLIEQGEDPRFIARRLLILASEDVGNADPMALVVVNAAASALDRVGLPEATLALTQAVTYLALAPKSNAVVVAYGEASHDVAERPAGPVPASLRDAHYEGAERLGHGIGYEYPHDDPRGWVDVDYLPDGLVGRRYYRATGRGWEQEAWDRLDAMRTETARDRAAIDRVASDRVAGNRAAGATAEWDGGQLTERSAEGTGSTERADK